MIKKPAKDVRFKYRLTAVFKKSSFIATFSFSIASVLFLLIAQAAAQAAPLVVKSSYSSKASDENHSHQLATSTETIYSTFSLFSIPSATTTVLTNFAASTIDHHATNSKYWISAQETVYRTVPELLFQQETEKKRGVRLKKLFRGNPKKKMVAITFDDGPHPAYTPALLSILKQHNVKATFFVVGIMAERYPQLLLSEVAAGHNIGNHTYHHVNLTKISPTNVATEIKACGEVIRSIAGKAPHLFRPPGGMYNKKVGILSEILGYTTVLWTDNPGDYKSPGENTIRFRTLRKINNGGIILLHDGVQQTVDALPDILDYLEKNGYQIVTIDEMMNSK